MFKYGTIHDIPAPQISIKVFSTNNRFNSETDAIADTGAAMTCIPKKVIDKIGEDKLRYKILTVRGAVGHASQMKSYIVHLRIGKCDFKNMEVIGFDREYALIGRDILNRYQITFDGPNLLWEVNEEC
jgi:predicted aspartyl protease